MNYQSKINVIGFDLDHTLYQGNKDMDRVIQEYIFKKIADHRGCSIDEAKKMFDELYQEGRGLSGRKTLIALGIPNAGEIIQEALENADVAQTLTSDSETIRMLNDLKQHYRNIDLITGSSREQALKKLSALGISEDFFSHYITDEVAFKGDGSAYTYWMKLYSLPAETFLYIGDRLEVDHIIPRTLGIETMLVNVKERSSEATCPQLKDLREIEHLLL
jgi:FMN phosphatase YigB (HAD superfamily)